MKKVNSLLTQDCKILVISDKVNTQLANYIKQKKIDFKKTKLKDGDFLSKYKPFLVMAATDDRELNRKIIQKAKKMKCFVYASDDPEVSDFAHPSVINIEDTVQIAISTGGRSPAMAKKIIPTQLERKKFLYSVLNDEAIKQLIKDNKLKKAQQRAMLMLRKWK